MSVYRRKGRPSWYSECRTRNGWRTVCWRTPDRRLALKMRTMWDTLSQDYRAWDLLDPVLSGSMTPGELYDLWVDSERRVSELRRRLSDTNLEPVVEEFLTVHKNHVSKDTLDHIRCHVRWLVKAGEPFPRSQATDEHLTRKLANYGKSRGTLRKVHSDWSGFFGYCTTTKKLFDRNPMEAVPRPPVEKGPPMFYDLETVIGIVEAQPTPARKALLALLYGTAIEISVALDLLRSDVDSKTREIRAAGTKAHTRDRMAIVAEWSWKIIWAYVRKLKPTDRLFPATWSRWTASDWHAETVKALGLPRRYPMKNARHHWAVRMIRAGAPIRVVQEQLGHSTPQLTLSIYGRFIPTGADRARWEKVAAKRDKPARTAKRTAKTRTSVLTDSRGGT